MQNNDLFTINAEKYISKRINIIPIQYLNLINRKLYFVASSYNTTYMFRGYRWIVKGM